MSYTILHMPVNWVRRGKYRLDELCDELIALGTLALRLPVAYGPRYKRLLYQGVPLDLFSVLPPAQWGVIMVIRTGPAQFSHRIVTPKRYGGLLPSHLRVKDGAVWHGEEMVPTPEEADFLRLLGLEWVEPWERK